MRADGPSLAQLTSAVPSFTAAAKPAVRELSALSDIGRSGLVASRPAATALHRFTSGAPTGIGLLDRFLTNVQSNGGIEYAYELFYGLATAPAPFDGVSHVITLNAIVTPCLTNPTAAGCDRGWGTTQSRDPSAQPGPAGAPPRAPDSASKRRTSTGLTAPGAQPASTPTSSPTSSPTDHRSNLDYDHAERHYRVIPYRNRAVPAWTARLPDQVSHRRRRSSRRDSMRLYAITGIIGIVVGLAIVYVSYTANGGLPFASTYRMYVELPNAQRLQRGSDVRIGGVRVGQVQAVSAARESRDGRVPFAKLELSLSPSIGHIPVDSHVEEQPASILGASYLQLTLGTSHRRLGPGGTLALSQSSPTVQLTDLLDIFDRATARSIQTSLGDFAGRLAGRGGDLNTTIASFSELLPQLQTVSQTLASSQADIGRFIDGLDATSTALTPVSGFLRALFGEAATSFQAFRGDDRALGASMDQLPGTEALTTTALAHVDPALAGAAQLARELVPGARLVRTDVPQLTSALQAGSASLGHVRPLIADLEETVRALATLSRDPATIGSLQVLGQATSALTTALDVIAPAQIQCNVIPLSGRNVAYSVQQGTSEFPFVPLGVVGTGATNEYAQHATPSNNLHVDYLPHENYQECESGNEPYSSTTQDLTSPPGNQPNHTQTTTPPTGVRSLAARAGLLGTGGAR